MYVCYPYKSLTLNKIKNSWYYVVRAIVQATFYKLFKNLSVRWKPSGWNAELYIEVKWFKFCHTQNVVSVTRLIS